MKNFQKGLMGWAVAAALCTTPASAQSTLFYGPNGSYEGNASTFEGSTLYYGSNGQYLGNSYSTGDSTIYSGSDGSYAGSSYGPAIAAPYGE
jgi:phospholipase/lecithinase/hemolysin